MSEDLVDFLLRESGPTKRFRPRTANELVNLPDLSSNIVGCHSRLRFEQRKRTYELLVFSRAEEHPIRSVLRTRRAPRDSVFPTYDTLPGGLSSGRGRGRHS